VCSQISTGGLIYIVLAYTVLKRGIQALMNFISNLKSAIMMTRGIYVLTEPQFKELFRVHNRLQDSG
jgi:hypothetical protein